MARGPLGNRRLTSIGPFTYDELSPPEVPRGWTPPEDIANALGDLRWWTRWEGAGPGDIGATIIYDPDADRVIIENRLSGPGGSTYTHDDMVTDLIQKSPFPKVPDLMVAAEGGVVELGGQVQSTLNMPTVAGGAWVVTERLSEDKEFAETGEDVEVGWFYKVVYALKIIDFPGDASVDLKHKLGPRANSVFEARRRFMLEDAYRLLQFEGELPQPKV